MQFIIPTHYVLQSLCMETRFDPLTVYKFLDACRSPASDQSSFISNSIAFVLDEEDTDLYLEIMAVLYDLREEDLSQEDPTSARNQAVPVLCIAIQGQVFDDVDEALRDATIENNIVSDLPIVIPEYCDHVNEGIYLDHRILEAEYPTDAELDAWHAEPVEGEDNFPPGTIGYLRYLLDEAIGIYLVRCFPEIQAEH